MSAAPTNSADVEALIELAERVIEVVRPAIVGGGPADKAGTVMFGAYLRAFRRFVAIAELARAGAGDEVAILVRSLVSLVARAAWVDQPTDTALRQDRWRRLAKQHLADSIKTRESEELLGVHVDPGELQWQREELDRFKSDRWLPDDRQMLEALDLAPFYHRVYRPASDFTHFSLGVATNDFLDIDEISLEHGSPAVVKDGLCFAILTYGVFLELSERTVQHGLSTRVRELVTEAGLIQATSGRPRTLAD